LLSSLSVRACSLPCSPTQRSSELVTPIAAAPWFCSFCWSVRLLLLEYALFSALLPWLTSPLFDPGLSTVTGALTLTWCDEASLDADCSVLFWLLADWVWSTCWPPLPPSPQPQAS